MPLIKLMGIYIICIAFTAKLQAQTIYYSQPDLDESSHPDFEIIGKLGRNIFILMHEADYEIRVYNDKMNLAATIKLPFEGEILDVKAVAYKNYFYLFYQYHQDDKIYSMMAKFNPNGDVEGTPTNIDVIPAITIGNVRVLNSSSLLYKIINSEDKSKIAIYRLTSGSTAGIQGITTFLFDSSLNLIKKSVIDLQDVSLQSPTTNFSLANDGTLVFLKLPYESARGSNPVTAAIVKEPMEDNVEYNYFNVTNLNLGDIYLKIDNINKHFLLSSFSATQKNGEMDGLYSSVWTLHEPVELYNTLITLSPNFIDSANGRQFTKRLPTRFVIKDAIFRSDGGFIVLAQSRQGNSMANWAPVYNAFSLNGYQPQYSPPVTQGTPGNTQPSFNAGDPYYNHPIFRNVFVNTLGNIVAVSFNSMGHSEWAKVIPQSLTDKDAEGFNGYTTTNMGDKISFLFNQRVKGKVILYTSTLDGDGKLSESLPAHNLDLKYSLMPQHAKQINANQLIMPFMYRRHLSFANIIF